MTKRIVKGYILLNGEGQRLNMFKGWDHTPGWVWSEQEMDEILQQSASWERRPSAIQPACYTPGDGSVVTTGEPASLLRP